ncbi:MAG: hypothetical protein Q8N98_02700, partial [bacterium]|nr:hypothetical protein [bacterium]
MSLRAPPWRDAAIFVTCGGRFFVGFGDATGMAMEVNEAGEDSPTDVGASLPKVRNPVSVPPWRDWYWGKKVFS